MVYPDIEKAPEFPMNLGKRELRSVYCWIRASGDGFVVPCEADTTHYHRVYDIGDLLRTRIDVKGAECPSFNAAATPDVALREVCSIAWIH